MLSTARLSLIPAALGLALLAAPVLAEKPAAAPQAMPMDATEALDTAAEVESMAAEAVEQEKVAKERALEAQGKELIQEEISGSNQ